MGLHPCTHAGGLSWGWDGRDSQDLNTSQQDIPLWARVPQGMRALFVYRAKEGTQSRKGAKAQRGEGTQGREGAKGQRGEGTQACAIWKHGILLVEPTFRKGAINMALRVLGVEKGRSHDEFAALGLGRYRHTEQWKGFKSK